MFRMFDIIFKMMYDILCDVSYIIYDPWPFLSFNIKQTGGSIVSDEKNET